jgi:hypothetical protein
MTMPIKCAIMLPMATSNMSAVQSSVNKERRIGREWTYSKIAIYWRFKCWSSTRPNVKNENNSNGRCSSKWCKATLWEPTNGNSSRTEAMSSLKPTITIPSTILLTLKWTSIIATSSNKLYPNDLIFISSHLIKNLGKMSSLWMWCYLGCHSFHAIANSRATLGFCHSLDGWSMVFLNSRDSEMIHFCYLGRNFHDYFRIRWCLVVADLQQDFPHSLFVEYWREWLVLSRKKSVLCCGRGRRRARPGSSLLICWPINSSWKRGFQACLIEHMVLAVPAWSQLLYCSSSCAPKSPTLCCCWVLVFVRNPLFYRGFYRWRSSYSQAV